jgi:hypothetical protein
MLLRHGGSGLACLGQASYDAQYNLGLLHQNGQGVPQDMGRRGPRCRRPPPQAMSYPWWIISGFYFSESRFRPFAGRAASGRTRPRLIAESHH